MQGRTFLLGGLGGRRSASREGAPPLPASCSKGCGQPERLIAVQETCRALLLIAAPPGREKFGRARAPARGIGDHEKDLPRDIPKKRPGAGSARAPPPVGSPLERKGLAGEGCGPSRTTAARPPLGLRIVEGLWQTIDRVSVINPAPSRDLFRPQCGLKTLST